jgi:hypothetical protein
VFSGRPDPEWPVTPALGERLAALWVTLPAATGPKPKPPVLGYRGCFLRRGDGTEWRAWDGIVEGGPETTEEAREDPDRAFERQVLESAPAGVLPPGVARSPD